MKLTLCAHWTHNASYAHHLQTITRLALTITSSTMSGHLSEFVRPFSSHSTELAVRRTRKELTLWALRGGFRLQIQSNYMWYLKVLQPTLSSLETQIPTLWPIPLPPAVTLNPKRFAGKQCKADRTHSVSCQKRVPIPLLEGGIARAGSQFALFCYNFATKH